MKRNPIKKQQHLLTARIRYEFGTSGLKRSKGRRIWDKLKWAVELRSLDDLRAKIAGHNGTLDLLLTFAGKYVNFHVVALPKILTPE